MEINALLAKNALQTLAHMELCVCLEFARPVLLNQAKLILVHLVNSAQQDRQNKLLTQLVCAILQNVLITTVLISLSTASQIWEYAKSQVAPTIMLTTTVQRQEHAKADHVQYVH